MNDEVEKIDDVDEIEVFVYICVCFLVKLFFKTTWQERKLRTLMTMVTISMNE